MRYGLSIAVVLLMAGTAVAQKTATKQPRLDCLSCHSDPTLTREIDGKPHSVHVDDGRFKASVHGALECADCHADIKEYPHDPAPKAVDCAGCHAESKAAYERGIHGKAVQKHDGVHAPGCLDCHGEPHAILASTDPNSPTSHARVPQTCGVCHGEKFVMEKAGRSTAPFLSYEQSVHGKAVSAGNGKAAVCTDCHSNHEILSAGDVHSPIFKFNVPQTCAKCHAEMAQQFNASIHGQAIARGNWQAPVCTDCHGIHTIKKHLDPTSSVAAQNLALATCAQCHEGVRLTQEFGIPGRRASSYLDSYHGLASKFGSQVVANCASCHGVHNILPSSDPRSTIHPAHLVETCGHCHLGASRKFALSKVHIDMPLSRDAGSIGTLWIRRVYFVLIFFTIGGMLLHNFIIWRRKAIDRRREAGRNVVRMSRGQRIQHLLLFGSFFTLAFTGFALKYPDSWLAALLGSSEAVRRVGHRIAAVVLLSVGAYHVWYISRNREGRQLFRDFLPTPQDVRDLRDTMLFYLGRSPRPPRYGRFSYADKVEYLALVWGTILMGVTGLVLWFPMVIMRALPRWWLDIASALHFYEAVLAVSAILVWHFYFVIFDPDVYPVNWAFWDGKVSEHHLRTHHARLFEQTETRTTQETTTPDPAANSDAEQRKPPTPDESGGRGK
jgi:cytochrome b subunit of formate dehydrogenase